MNKPYTNISNLSPKQRAAFEMLLKKKLAGGSRPGIARLSRNVESFPLSFAQQQQWLLDQLEPGSAIYNNHQAVYLKGSLDLSALEKTLSEIIRRHESLRTRFASLDGQPVQVIQDARPITLEPISLLHLPESDRLRFATELANQEATEPFVLEQGGLMRVKLVKLAPQEHVVMMTMHHIISDDWSMAILVKEVAELYDSYSRGQESQLEELDIQYADFAVWQRTWLSGDVLEKQLQYWRKQLGGNLKPLNLPTDRPRTALLTFHGARQSITLPGPLCAELKSFSNREGATLFMTMLAAFKVLLYSYTSQEDIVIGCPISGRTRTETEGLIGYFINALALRTDLSGNPTFLTLLARVKEITLDAYANQDVPLEMLLEKLPLERYPNRMPVFQVIFNFQNKAMPALELGGMTVDLLKVERDTAKYDLTLYVAATGEEMQASMVYNTDLFDAGTISVMLDRYKALLGSLVARPDDRLNSINFLSADEKRERVLNHQKRESDNLKKLVGMRRKTVRLSQEKVIKTGYLETGETLPLVIEPAAEDADLIAWAESEREFIETALLKHGAILFRGFNIESVARYQQFASTITPELVNYIEGSSPRIKVSDKVYTSTEYPREFAISMHNELSYAHKCPGKLFFFCVEAPQQGGETPIADCRRFFQLLDPAIKERFIRKGVKYTRNLHGHSGAGLSWQAVFETEDKTFVEDYCRAANIDFKWKDDGGLWTSQVRPSVISHPKTGEPVWFNQADQWHPSNLGPELAKELWSVSTEAELPINAYYGDDSPIETETLDEIRELFQQVKIAFRWQQGDILLIDNILVAHGRRPFAGPRKIVVAMGAPINLYGDAQLGSIG